MKARLSRRNLYLCLAIAYGLLACISRWSSVVNNTSPQGWWSERGPVVPHDSFPSDCRLCHTGGDWNTIRQDFSFDHEKETGVALRGAHEHAECLRCHNDRGPAALFAQRGCVGCHEDVHRGQLGPDCSACHQETNWEPEGMLALHAMTRLPLVGAHAAVQCWACHSGAEVGNFRNASPECAGCHLDDFQATTSPDHAAAGFPLTCDDCHGFSSFTGATTFSHAGITNGCAECHLPAYERTTDPNHLQAGFSTSCEDCHGTNTWRGAGFSHAGITNGCAECHLPDYQRAADPNHVAQAFPTTCETCHSSTTTWQGAPFDHAGIRNDCRRCHLPDYQASSAPNHPAAGFSQTCESCHTSTTTWQGARYEAHSFPIYSGAHRNFDCVECHLTPTNLNVFSCTHCHTHRQSSMDSKHDNESGYSWQSSRCYDCHPNGRG